MAFASSPSMSHASATPPRRQQDASPAPPLSPVQRQLKQLGLLFAGAGFMAASIAVARRSVLRRQLESLPKFYSSNRAQLQQPVDSGERGLMAVQALGLATLNVMSFGVLLTGGISWAFDLCSLAELRGRTQAALRRQGGDFASPEDEQEMEKMMSSILDRLGMQKPQDASPKDQQGEGPDAPK